jgi:hypothetical protein
VVIINSEVDIQIKQAAGNYRVKFKYTLDDARVFFIGPVNVNTLAEIATLLISKKPQLEQTIIDIDSDEANDLDITIPHKSASQAQVYYNYLKKGMAETDPIASYKMLNKVADDVIALGKTNSELAVYFNVEVSEVQEVVARWQYLKANTIDILAYKAVKDGM